jgi:hypothetical protein
MGVAVIAMMQVRVLYSWLPQYHSRRCLVYWNAWRVTCNVRSLLDVMVLFATIAMGITARNILRYLAVAMRGLDYRDVTKVMIFVYELPEKIRVARSIPTA